MTDGSPGREYNRPMPSPQWMIYGATGYTGTLAAREACERGERPILAGRNREKVEALARELDCEARVVSLDDRDGLRRALIDVVAVLHCAGPFAWTSRPMVDACLATGTHYLDITGEIDVFEAVLNRDSAARTAHAVLLPGVGFDVVPTDCLAARLSMEVPRAMSLELAFFTDGGGVSAGTMKSMIERLPAQGAVRRDGRIESIPLVAEQREIEFTCGPRWTATIPWGDVSTAYYSTGIPNIKVYTGISPRGAKRAARMRTMRHLIGWTPVKRCLQWWIGRRVDGPGPEARSKARVYLWGRAENARRRGATATFDVPEGYTFTAAASVDAARRVAAGEVEPGAKTPSLAFGAAYIESLPGVSKITVDHDG